MNKLTSKTKSTHFTPAELHEGKSWYISYYITNPYNGVFTRKRIKINRIKSVIERRKYAKKVIFDLNKKLYNDWNPFLEQEAPKSFNKLYDVCDLYLKGRIRDKLSPDSIRTYRSFVGKFQAWLTLVENEGVFVVNFKKNDALNYLNYCFNEHKIKNITYNSLLQWCNVLYNWMVENQYASENVFKTFAKKKAEPKERVVIPNVDRIRIKNYLEKNDRGFLFVCLLVFGSLIRPKEITFLKPEYFDLKNQIITLPAFITKNKKKRIATIPDSNLLFFAQYLGNVDILPGHYLFGGSCTSSNTQTNAKRYSKKWLKVRKALAFPMEYKLYSLRDSGIIQLLQNGVSPEEVMKLADHSSLEITSVYVKHANPQGSSQIKSKSSGF